MDGLRDQLDPREEPDAAEAPEHDQTPDGEGLLEGVADLPDEVPDGDIGAHEDAAPDAAVDGGTDA